MTRNSLSSRVVRLQDNLSHLRYSALPLWIRKAVSWLAKLSALAVLMWMLYATYQERDRLLAALQLKPWYFIPFAACYATGFLFAVISWHRLLNLLGVRHHFIDDYTMYTYMSVYRYFPLPYSHIAALLYTYQKLGTGYWTTGLAIIMTSVLHIVAGLLLFCGTLLVGVDIAHHGYVVMAVIGGTLVSLLLHPSVFTSLVRLRSSPSEQANVPPITWTTTLFLVGLNIVVLFFGGLTIFFAASAILDVPLSLLPVCVAAWGLMVSVLNLLSWLPSDFGAARVIPLILFQGYLPVALITATYATWRLGLVILDLMNAGIAFLLHYRHAGRNILYD